MVENAVRNGCIFPYLRIFIVMITEVVANLNGSEFGPVGGSTLRQQIRSFYASIGGVAKTAFGEVLLDDKSVKSDLGHPNYRNKTCSFAAVKDVLEKGIIIKPMAHYGIHGKKQETGIISANIMIKGQPFKMDVVVIKNEDEILRVRCHDVYQTTLAENHQKGLITKRIRRTLIESPSCCPNGDSGAKIKQKTKTAKDNNIKTENYTNMNKKLIRLTESDLKQIVKESVSKLLKEAYEDAFNDDYYNRIRPIQDGINAVNIEVTNKFRLNEYELTIHGSIQNNEIIFQLDNTAIIAGVDESFPCDWDEFQIIAKHIYNHLKSIGIKTIGKPSLRKDVAIGVTRKCLLL